MQSLAMELGHSVTFPKICHYCGKQIFLYANQNGGFAIFEGLGKPWPKHDCRGLAERRFEAPRTRSSYIDRYRILSEPVPFRVPELGEVISGSVSMTVPSSRADIESFSHLFDGGSIVRMILPIKIPEGINIQGEIVQVGEYSRLARVYLSLVPIDVADTFPLPDKPIFHVLVFRESMWLLRDVIEEGMISQPRLSILLCAALDAWVNKAEIIDLVLILAALKFDDESLSRIPYARCVAVAFEALARHNLHFLAPGLRHSLPWQIYSAAARQLPRQIDKIVTQGLLQLKREPHDELRQSLLDLALRDQDLRSWLVSIHPELNDLLPDTEFGLSLLDGYIPSESP